MALATGTTPPQIGAPQLVGVLNVTPDSFSDGGRFAAAGTAITGAREMLAQGAHLIDIGGASTAPGSSPVPAEVEWQRIAPVVEALAREMPLSIDTYRVDVARQALALGAQMINDVSAFRAEPDMVRLVADAGCRVILMHAKDAPLPHASDVPRHYGDVIGDIGDFLAERVDHAMAHGIPADRLILDPGMGRFVSIDPADSWQLLSRFDELVARFAPIPVMVGTSRKGFLGGRLADRDPVSQLTALAACLKGARFVRTHNVPMAAEFLAAARAMGMMTS